MPCKSCYAQGLCAALLPTTSCPTLWTCLHCASALERCAKCSGSWWYIAQERGLRMPNWMSCNTRHHPIVNALKACALQDDIVISKRLFCWFIAFVVQVEVHSAIFKHDKSSDSISPLDLQQTPHEADTYQMDLLDCSSDAMKEGREVI